ncbi:MAG: spermidine synthase, partial [Gemmatimonadaceae bacterium]|nr:spermidine synthase [Acetobacteraceae bacterium]
MSAGFAVLATLSGFAGLGYEVVWTRMLALQLGHDITAALGVITAFFGGLAFGSVTLGVWAARSARPDRWYAGLELVVAAWACALIGLLPWTGGAAAALLGPDPGAGAQWAVD